MAHTKEVFSEPSIFRWGKKRELGQKAKASGWVGGTRSRMYAFGLANQPSDPTSE